MGSASPGAGAEAQPSAASTPTREPAWSHLWFGHLAQLTSAPLLVQRKLSGPPVCSSPGETRARRHVTSSPTASGKLKLKQEATLTHCALGEGMHPPRQEGVSRGDTGALTSLKKEEDYLSALPWASLVSGCNPPCSRR